MLTLYEKYNREGVQELFQPDYIFKQGTGTWGFQGVIQLPNKQNERLIYANYPHFLPPYY